MACYHKTRYVLLNGMNSDADVQTSEKEEERSDDVVEQVLFSDTENMCRPEISNISMGTAATTLSSLLSQKVNITTPSVSVARWKILSVDIAGLSRYAPDMLQRGYRW